MLDDVAEALADRDRAAVQAALERGRAIDDLARELEDALDVGRETARLAPPRRRTLDTVDDYAEAARQIELAVRNVRVLARGARRAIDLEENVPPEVSDALRDLAAAVRALGEALDNREHADAVREPALRAAGQRHARARAARATSPSPSSSARSAPPPSTCSAAPGISYEDAAEAVRAAAREQRPEPDRPPLRADARPALIAPRLAKPRLAGGAPVRRAAADRVPRARRRSRSAGSARRAAGAG